MNNIREKLFELADKKYADFSKSLTPNCKPMIGVRVPELRKITKEIAKGDFRSFLKEGEEEYFEELDLKGMVIGYCKTDIDEKLNFAIEFIPKINDWAINDAFCAGFKCAKKNQEKVYNFLMDYVESESEFEQRVVAVMLMNYFLTEEYIDRVLEVLNKLKHEGYYTKMGVAWAIATAYAKFPEKVHNYMINGNELPDFTYNKAIRKMMESYRITDEAKNELRKMVRK